MHPIGHRLHLRVPLRRLPSFNDRLDHTLCRAIEPNQAPDPHDVGGGQRIGHKVSVPVQECGTTLRVGLRRRVGIRIALRKLRSTRHAVILALGAVFFIACERRDVRASFVTKFRADRLQCPVANLAGTLPRGGDCFGFARQTEHPFATWRVEHHLGEFLVCLRLLAHPIRQNARNLRLGLRRDIWVAFDAATQRTHARAGDVVGGKANAVDGRVRDVEAKPKPNRFREQCSQRRRTRTICFKVRFHRLPNVTAERREFFHHGALLLLHRGHVWVVRISRGGCRHRLLHLQHDVKEPEERLANIGVVCTRL